MRILQDSLEGMRIKAQLVTQTIKSIESAGIVLIKHVDKGGAWRGAAMQAIVHLCNRQCFVLDSGFLGLSFEGQGKVMVSDMLVMLEDISVSNVVEAYW